MLRKFNTTVNHKPGKILKGEWIGIEIECFMPYYDLLGPTEKIGYYSWINNPIYAEYSWIDAKKKLGELIKKAKIPNVTLKRDSSIDPPDNYFDVEVNILFNRKNYKPLKKLCQLLNKLGADINDSCGLHVHLDCRDLGTNLGNKHPSLDGYKYDSTTAKEVLRRGERLGKALPLMLKMVYESRRDNEYCDPFVGSLDGGRTAVNLSAFREHGSIEVRLHHGTVNFDTIKNWTEFLYFISRNKIESEVEKITELKKEVLRVPKKIENYVKKAIKEAA